ncbi:MAG: hypothetical protein AAGF24_01055 [Cyanobacteria bacterium P01_H01_bin.121]
MSKKRSVQQSIQETRVTIRAQARLQTIVWIRTPDSAPGAITLGFCANSFHDLSQQVTQWCWQHGYPEQDCQWDFEVAIAA